MKRNEMTSKLSEHIEDANVVKEIVDYIFSENGNDINKLKEEIKQKDDIITQHNEQIESLNKSIEEFEQGKADTDKLNKDLENWKTKYDDLIATNKRDKEDRQINEALKNANCTDVDFALYKIGRDNFHFDKDGSLIGFDETIKEFKDNHADFFSTSKKVIEEPNKNKPDDDYDFEKAMSNLGW